MQWVSDRNTSGPPEVFSATAPRGRRMDALHEMWKFFATTVLPANAGVAWSCFRAEIWADTGRVLLFPYDAMRKERIEKAGLCLNIPELQDKYEELESLDEDSFEAGLTAELRALADEILAAAQATKSAPGLVQDNIPVEVWEAEEGAPTTTGLI